LALSQCLTIFRSQPSVKLTPKDYVTDLSFPKDIITETINEGQPQLEAINFIFKVYKEAFKWHWGENIAITIANFIVVQIFIEGIKPEMKNEKNVGLIGRSN
jgi:hypothetical protein